MSKWIDVNEEKPAQKGYVWAKLQDGTIEMAYFGFGEFRDPLTWFSDWGPDVYDVTHWVICDVPAGLRSNSE